MFYAVTDKTNIKCLQLRIIEIYTQEIWTRTRIVCDT